MKATSADSPIFQTSCPLCHEGKVIITVGKLCTCTSCKAFIECVKCGNSQGIAYVYDGPNSYFYCHECKFEFGWDWRDGSSVYATKPSALKNDKCPKCDKWWSFRNHKSKPYWFCPSCKTLKIPDQLLLNVISYSLGEKFGKDYYFIAAQDTLSKYSEYMTKKKRRPKPGPNPKSVSKQMNKIVPIEQWLAFQEYQKKGNKELWEEFRRFRDMKDSLRACGSELIEAFTVIKNSVENGSVNDLDQEVEVLEKSVMDLDSVLSEVFLTNGHRWDNDEDLWRQNEDKDRWPDDEFITDGDESYRLVPHNHNQRKIVAEYSEVLIEDVPGDIFAVAEKTDKPKSKKHPSAEDRVIAGGYILSPPDENGQIVCRFPSGDFRESRRIGQVEWQEWADEFNVQPSDFPLGLRQTTHYMDCEDCETCNEPEELRPTEEQISKAKALLDKPMDIDNLVLKVHSLRRQYDRGIQNESPITCKEISLFIVNEELTESQIEEYVKVMGVASCTKKDKHALRRIRVSEDLINCLNDHIVENWQQVDELAEKAFRKKKEPNESIDATELYQIMKELAEWREVHSLCLSGGHWVPKFEDGSSLDFSEVNGLLFGSKHDVISEAKIKRWIIAVGIAPLKSIYQNSWPQALLENPPGLAKRQPSREIIAWIKEYLQYQSPFEKINRYRDRAGKTSPITYLEAGKYLTNKVFTEQEIRTYVEIAGIQPYDGIRWEHLSGKVLLDDDCVISQSLCDFFAEHLLTPEDSRNLYNSAPHVAGAEGLPVCCHRQEFDAKKKVFFCDHPQVHTNDNLVDSSICRACDRHKPSKNVVTVIDPEEGD